MQRTQEEDSGTRCALGCDCVFFLIWELTNHARASGKGFQNRVSPSGGKNRSNLLIDLLVCLREEARKLSLWRRSEFLYGDDEADLSGSLRLLEREMMQQSQFFGDILLSKLPIAHKTLRPKIAMQVMNGIQDRRILGSARDQVNAGKKKVVVQFQESHGETGSDTEVVFSASKVVTRCCPLSGGGS